MGGNENKGGKRKAGLKKKKSIKAKVTTQMGSKRRLSRMGKEQKAGHRGAAAAFLTRGQALRRLQMTLKDFRRLCILKGIYPREPKKEFKGSNTTYYFAKDIQFLMHEPLLDKFRVQKAFLKKIRRATGRHEKKKAMRLDGRRPEYKLDHLIRERYPTFADALQELDDALCLVFLFASLSPSKFVHNARVQTCARLRREFLAYIARTRALLAVGSTVLIIKASDVLERATAGGEAHGLALALLAALALAQWAWLDATAPALLLALTVRATYARARARAFA